MANKIGRRTSKILAQQEREVYKRLIVVLSIVVFLVVVMLFWGLQILVKFAEVLDMVRGQGPTASVRDTIPPSPPIFDGLPPATNSAKLKISGLAESGADLEILLNGESKEKLLLGTDGKFEIDNFSLEEGNNKIEATVTDKAGNKSQVSSQIEIVYDKTKPLLEINKPTDGTTVIGNNNRVLVEGNTEQGATVTVNGQWAITDEDGKFSTNYPLSDGENILKIVSSDIAGNISEGTRKVYYSR